MITSQSDPQKTPRPARARSRREGWTIRIAPSGVLLLVLVNLLILGGLAYGINRFLLDRGYLGQPGSTPAALTPLQTTLTPTSEPSFTATSAPTASSTPQEASSLTPAPSPTSPQPISTLSLTQGLIILAVDEGGNTHLFAYQPAESGAGQPLPLTRLTYGPWDDITPASSPDGQKVAFASNRSGYWDIYLMDIASGSVTRLTDTQQYEAAPSWSPDNQWLAYEAYLNGNLDIVIQSVTDPSQLIQLTSSPSADFNPAWSPKGRQILFVSNRSGEDDIWLADLDKSESERFMDISRSPNSPDTHPAWSPDGESIAWVGMQDGLHSLFLYRMASPAGAVLAPSPFNLGSGDWPVWSRDGETILTLLEAPNRTYLTAYPVHYPGLVLPTLELPGGVSGISWGVTVLSAPLSQIYQAAAQLTPTPLYVSHLTLLPEENGGRYQLAPLLNVDAPQAFLHDAVDDSFTALRSRIANETGWDFLASLENAYVPLTSPLEPGMGDDWLYTGRAFAFNTLPLDAGWLQVVREDFGAETYWHIYLRARYQDGSAGIPLHDLPWDFAARSNGDTGVYERGGAVQATIPPGYWIDFTLRARAYDWERVPALTAWRASFTAARFNEYVSPGGLNWETAMLELYPPEALITPTAVIPPTRTPSPTSRWYVSPTPTLTPSPRPTNTPEPPGATPTP